MAQQPVRELMLIAVEAAAFLELSGDDVVDEDAAVEQMESIAARLQALPPAELEEFLRLVEEEAQRAARKGDRPLAEFLEGFPESFGLLPEDGA